MIPAATQYFSNSRPDDQPRVYGRPDDQPRVYGRTDDHPKVYGRTDDQPRGFGRPNDQSRVFEQPRGFERPDDARITKRVQYDTPTWDAPPEPLRSDILRRANDDESRGKGLKIGELVDVEWSSQTSKCIVIRPGAPFVGTTAGSSKLSTDDFKKFNGTFEKSEFLIVVEVKPKTIVEPWYCLYILGAAKQTRLDRNKLDRLKALSKYKGLQFESMAKETESIQHPTDPSVIIQVPPFPKPNKPTKKSGKSVEKPADNSEDESIEDPATKRPSKQAFQDKSGTKRPAAPPAPGDKRLTSIVRYMRENPSVGKRSPWTDMSGADKMTPEEITAAAKEIEESHPEASKRMKYGLECMYTAVRLVYGDNLPTFQDEQLQRPRVVVCDFD